MLTPAFHFRILEDFLDVMNGHCNKLCDILEPLCNCKEFNVFPLVRIDLSSQSNSFVFR